MTMPDERTRAMCWGADLLERIASDTSLPHATITAARRIALSYPTQQALAQRLRSDAASMPPNWTAVLFEALQLFEEMKIKTIGSETTRTHMMYTLRHFPDQMTLRAMSRTSMLGQWLQLPTEQQVQQSGPP